MRYVSTRGEAPELAFEDVLLTGLARDGGLYVPAHWPEFSEAELAELSGCALCRCRFCGDRANSPAARCRTPSSRR